jgi:hypothetical protein
MDSESSTQLYQVSNKKIQVQIGFAGPQILLALASAPVKNDATLAPLYNIS